MASTGDELIGYLWLVWYEHIEYKGVAYIEELYVDEKYRNRKVASSLIQEAMRLLKEAKIKTIYVAVGEHMKEAHKFYCTIGFRPSDEKWFEINTNQSD